MPAGRRAGPVAAPCCIHGQQLAACADRIRPPPRHAPCPPPQVSPWAAIIWRPDIFKYSAFNMVPTDKMPNGGAITLVPRTPRILTAMVEVGGALGGVSQKCVRPQAIDDARGGRAHAAHPDGDGGGGQPTPSGPRPLASHNHAAVQLPVARRLPGPDARQADEPPQLRDAGGDGAGADMGQHRHHPHGGWGRRKGRLGSWRSPPHPRASSTPIGAAPCIGCHREQAR